MDRQLTFDPLERFAEIERLVAKVYFRFSHLFLHQVELRDFWWQMAIEEEQHSAILRACKEMISNDLEEAIDPSVTREKAAQLEAHISAYLSRGTRSITVDEAFRVALEIEKSELDAIYGKLLQLGGPKIAKTMENLGVPASIQRHRLRLAIRRFVKDPGLLADAERI